MKIVESNTLSIAREFNAVILKRLSAMENLTDTQDAAWRYTRGVHYVFVVVTDIVMDKVDV